MPDLLSGLPEFGSHQITTLGEQEFWELLTLLDWSNADDESVVVQPLVARLKEMSEGEIREYYEYYSRAIYLLDTRRHFAASGTTSDDTFLYARMAVLANGRELFQDVLVDPAQFPKNLWFEGFFGTADEAYLEVSGNEFDRAASVSIESGSNEAGWAR